MVEGPIQSHQENPAPQAYGFWGKHGRERWYLTVRDAFVESGRSLLKPPFKPMTMSGAIIGGVALRVKFMKEDPLQKQELISLNF